MTFMDHILYFLEAAIGWAYLDASLDYDHIAETHMFTCEALQLVDDDDGRFAYEQYCNESELVPIKDNGQPIQVTYGSEGDKHDPTAYTEVRVGTVTIHLGLGCWIDAVGDNLTVLRNQITDEDVAKHLFELNAGISYEDAMRLWEQRQYYCFNCRCSDYENRAGHPGETFIICCRCGDVLSSDVNLRAVE